MTTESILQEEFHLFDHQINTRVFECVTPKVKFDFSEKIVEYIVSQLVVKFQLPSNVISTPVLCDIFINVCCRICINTELLHEYFTDDSCLPKIQSSDVLNTKVNTAIRMVSRFSNIRIELEPLEKEKFMDAIKYGIIFMIAKNYFRVGNFETI